MLVDECVLYGLDLGADDREHRDVDAVELVKAAPRSTLAQAREQLAHSLHENRITVLYKPVQYEDDTIRLWLHNQPPSVHQKA